MTGGRTSGPLLRDVLLLAFGAAGTALSITLMFLGMRAVMDIGGACADGGPYVPVQSCPDGVALVMVLASFGLFAFGGIATWYGMRVGGIWTAAPLFAWAGLFLSLGWNFIDYGIVDPPADEGVIWGWAIPGVMFIAMGAAPLVFAAPVLGSIRRPTPESPRGGPPVVRTVPLGPAPADPRPGGAHAFDEGTQALLDRIERLADLRDRGLLGVGEYETAKDAVMRELERRS